MLLLLRLGGNPVTQRKFNVRAHEGKQHEVQPENKLGELITFNGNREQEGDTPTVGDGEHITHPRGHYISMYILLGI